MLWTFRSRLKTSGSHCEEEGCVKHLLYVTLKTEKGFKSLRKYLGAGWSKRPFMNY